MGSLFDLAVGAAVSVGILAYLVVVLVRPDKF